MIYRGSAFSPSYDLALPTPPLASVSSGRLSKRDSLLMGEAGEEGGGGGGAKSYDDEKALSSFIIQLILSISDYSYTDRCPLPLPLPAAKFR